MIYLFGTSTHYGYLLGRNYSLLNCFCYTQTETGLNKEVADSGAGGKRPDISLQVPPRPLGFGSGSTRGRVLDHSQSFSKVISSPKDFLRALSFKRKENVVDGESSSLLNSDPKPAADSTRMASISEVSWSRCTSLPVSHAPNLSPLVATPVSARTYNEQQIKPRVSPLLFH